MTERAKDGQRVENARRRRPKAAVLCGDKNGHVVGIRRDQVRKAVTRHIGQVHAPVQCRAVDWRAGCGETSTRNLEWSRGSKAPPAIAKSSVTWVRLVVCDREVGKPVLVEIRDGRGHGGVEAVEGGLVGGHSTRALFPHRSTRPIQPSIRPLTSANLASPPSRDAVHDPFPKSFFADRRIVEILIRDHVPEWPMRSTSRPCARNAPNSSPGRRCIPVIQT